MQRNVYLLGLFETRKEIAQWIEKTLVLVFGDKGQIRRLVFVALIELLQETMIMITITITITIMTMAIKMEIEIPMMAEIARPITHVPHSCAVLSSQVVLAFIERPCFALFSTLRHLVFGHFAFAFASFLFFSP